ncbi:hypothetical protein DB35_06610 [Streptomyces abyssalis]|uniref:ABM domain-containing protein n=1 Tax=Streptomyces abyssalis TaxID=933944 RepID=A0A1E7JT02_9ACTN|nr:hypothetical protein [Streptomyces abyssalis]OEU92018.1 hypothetical protein AN215_06155 [Streptomyces abyssalis]OEU94704.1 hypothetical protein DB35_06610 [Streptomyces abyssalis]
MGDMVIVGYRPKPGGEEELLALTREHVPMLRRFGLATDRPVLVMRAKGRVIVEVFEWRDGGITAAHEHPDVLAMWDRYVAVCDYVPLRELSETGDMFAQFEPVDL